MAGIIGSLPGDVNKSDDFSNTSLACRISARIPTGVLEAAYRAALAKSAGWRGVRSATRRVGYLFSQTVRKSWK